MRFLPMSNNEDATCKDCIHHLDVMSLKTYASTDDCSLIRDGRTLTVMEKQMLQRVLIRFIRNNTPGVCKYFKPTKYFLRKKSRAGELIGKKTILGQKVLEFISKRMEPCPICNKKIETHNLSCEKEERENICLQCHIDRCIKLCKGRRGLCKLYREVLYVSHKTN